MTYYLYSILDKLMKNYSVPVCAMSDDVATRDFEDACMEPGNPFMKHPSDYTLMLLGSIDTTTGVITPIEPTPIARAYDFDHKIGYVPGNLVTTIDSSKGDLVDE